jgi:1,4-alpha-glucan branching enzyme
MGGELGQWAEWNHDASLDWHLLEYPPHQGVQRWVRDLNRLYRDEPCLHQRECEPGGFEWVDCNDSQQSIVSFLRRGAAPGEAVLVACNFTPVPRHGYRVGVPWGGHWQELLNGDAFAYGGSGQGNLGGVVAVPEPAHGRPCTVRITLPPLAVVFFKGVEERTPPAAPRP